MKSPTGSFWETKETSDIQVYHFWGENNDSRCLIEIPFELLEAELNFSCFDEVQGIIFVMSWGNILPAQSRGYPLFKRLIQAWGPKVIPVHTMTDQLEKMIQSSEEVNTQISKIANGYTSVCQSEDRNEIYFVSNSETETQEAKRVHSIANLREFLRTDEPIINTPVDYRKPVITGVVTGGVVVFVTEMINKFRK